MVTKSRRQERKMPPDQPVIDTTPYGYGKDDSVTDLTEKSAITNHVLVTKGKSIRYTAMAGHLVTTDPYSAQPAAKIFDRRVESPVSQYASGASFRTRGMRWADMMVGYARKIPASQHQLTPLQAPTIRR
jgi:hypothetical protein